MNFDATRPLLGEKLIPTNFFFSDLIMWAEDLADNFADFYVEHCMFSNFGVVCFTFSSFVLVYMHIMSCSVGGFCTGLIGIYLNVSSDQSLLV